MEWQEILTIAVSTGVVTVPAATFLARLLVQHRLHKDLKVYEADITERLASHKADLDAQVNATKSAHDASLRREVEEYLGDRAADRTYAVEARKRLYLAVGPLRFQLLIACSEFASRVHAIGTGQAYDMSMDAYFGRSTAYRLLRVLAVCELVERQVAFADFTVDPAMRSLLHFRRKAFDTLAGHEVTLGHPQQDWTHQREHIFKDVLGSLAGALIVQDGSSVARVMRFEEFIAALSQQSGYRLGLEPVPRLITGFTVEAKPLFWLRLLALAQLCNQLVQVQGELLGIQPTTIDLAAALRLTNDAHILRNAAAHLSAIEAFAVLA